MGFSVSRPTSGYGFIFLMIRLSGLDVLLILARYDNLVSFARLTRVRTLVVYRRLARYGNLVFFEGLTRLLTLAAFSSLTR